MTKRYTVIKGLQWPKGKRWRSPGGLSADWYITSIRAILDFEKCLKKKYRNIAVLFVLGPMLSPF